MEFENQNSQSQSTPCFNNPYFYTPDNTQHFYSVQQPHVMSQQQNPFQQVPQTNFWNQGANLFNCQQQQQQPQQGLLFQQQPLQIPTQQFFQQPPIHDEEDQDQDYQPESEDESSSEEEQEELQEEEQFDDPDFDLQAYLKVRDQL